MTFKIDVSLKPFFSPQGVVIVGASHNPTKLGYGLCRNLVQSGYQGAIHFVNIKGGSLLGYAVHTSIAAVSDPADLAVLLIPAPAVPASIRECGQRGIRAVIVASGGFREVGPEGAKLEETCVRTAREYGIRMIGPNCIGLLDTHLPMDTTFLPPPGPTAGDVAFISHSGAICAAVIDWARGQGFGLSRLVSLGNQADVNETDMLAPVAEDRHSRVLTLYLEGVSNGRRFVEEAEKVTRHKPVIALKVGRFKSGQRAVASHTGALAGEEGAFNAAFRRAGVIRVETSEDLFDWARALAWCPLPEGRSVAILTNSGGPGVTAVDTLEGLGMQIAELQPKTVAALRAELDPSASTQNPVDMLASATPQQYAESLRVLLADTEVDSVLVILPPPPMHTAGGVAKAMIPVIYSADKPVVVALMGERLIQEAVELFRAARVPDYRFPERAAGALAILAERAATLKRKTTTEPETPDPPGMHADTVAAALQAFQQEKSGQYDGFLPQEIANQILKAYGLPTLRMQLAHSAEEAADLAEAMGFPVALKVASPHILHKSDVGGVLLNLTDAEAVRAGFDAITTNGHNAQPGAEILGAHVQPMIPHGQEVIVGTIQDAQFGPLIMFGSGGVEVEGLKDVEFALAPLSREEAEYLLENTWAGRKLHGYRNLSPADREAVIEAILRLAQLAADFPALSEVEINPLRVLPEGQGAFALDVRVRVSNG
ncbi:MAG TPA: acetate--CoA ligase family protein [Anaerolineales bacterium]